MQTHKAFIKETCDAVEMLHKKSYVDTELEFIFAKFNFPTNYHPFKQTESLNFAYFMNKIMVQFQIFLFAGGAPAGAYRAYIA